MTDLNITLTDDARQQFITFLAAEDDSEQVIGLAVNGHGPNGFKYQLDLVKEADVADHIRLDYDGFRLYVDPASRDVLTGVTIGFVQRGLESGFHFENPNSRWQDPIARRVQDVLDQQINPSVASHGGFVQLLDVKEATAYISLGGGCQGCGMADVTLKEGIVVAIREAVPEIETVLDRTDHAAGENPYYQGGGGSPFA